MIIPQAVLRALDPKVYDAVQSYRVTDDKLMPIAYRKLWVPQGRFLHDDWAIGSGTPRIETAYRVPLPFRQDSGASQKKWMLWDPSYPASPGLQIEVRPIWTEWGTFNLPHALVDQQIEGSGAASFSAFIGGVWMPVFTSYRKVIFGRLLAQYSGGLKQDVTVTPQSDGSIKSDIMGWWDPPSLSYNKVS